jgi:hypothetical protein
MPCDYRGVRTSGRVYIEYRGVVPPQEGHGPCEPANEVEHYDLRSDPFQLENLFPAPADSPEAARAALLATRVARLSDCAGIRGRDPVPSTGQFCE